MLAKTIITIFTFAFAAAATPVEVEARTAGCGNGLKQYCCNTFQQEKLFGIIPVQVGISCIAVSLLPLGSQCQQKVACCGPTQQTGLVNVGNICPIIL